MTSRGVILSFCFLALWGRSCTSEPGELAVNRIDSLQVNFNMSWALNWDSVEALTYLEDSSSVLLMVSRIQTFNRRFKVETREFDRDDLYEVVRVSQLWDNTATQMIFRKEDPLRLQKMTFSTQDIDGNTFIEILADRFIYRYIYSSYYEGDGYEKISKNVLFEDQLVYTLRSLNFAESMRFSCQVLPSIQKSKAALPQEVKTSFSVSRNPKGSWVVRVDFPARWTEYTFAEAFPNELLQINKQDEPGWKLLVQSQE